MNKSLAPEKIFCAFLYAAESALADIREHHTEISYQQLMDIFDILYPIPKMLLHWNTREGGLVVERCKAFEKKWKAGSEKNYIRIRLSKRASDSHCGRTDIAPEPYLTAYLSTLHHAMFHCKRMIQEKQMPRDQISDLCEALHKIPSLVTDWGKHFKKQEPEILCRLKSFDEKSMDRTGYCRFNIFFHFLNILSYCSGENIIPAVSRNGNNVYQGTDWEQQFREALKEKVTTATSVKPGMTYSEVTAILGQPDNKSLYPNAYGIVKPWQMAGSWKMQDQDIVITFGNDRVEEKFCFPDNALFTENKPHSVYTVSSFPNTANDTPNDTAKQRKYEIRILSETSNRQNQDYAEIVRKYNGLLLIIADGAGGTEDGFYAAATISKWVRNSIAKLCHWNNDRIIHENFFLDPLFWKDVLFQVDSDYCRMKNTGETTCVAAAICNGLVVGAGVGDSGAWLVSGDDLVILTENQYRKPLMGTGNAIPVSFGPFELKDRLVLATDGLFKYAKQDDIIKILKHGNMEECAKKLTDCVRLPSGTLWDDTTVLICKTLGI